MADSEKDHVLIVKSRKEYRILAVVPARGGSKGVLGKNIRPLAGKPLIIYTLEAARDSGIPDRTIVTTDSAEIRDVVMGGGFDCPFLRPPKLAQDDTPLILAVKHALETVESNGEKYSAVCLLQPTSPFRTAEHIRTACREFEKRDCDTLVSVVRVPHRFVPKTLMIQKGDYLDHYMRDSVSDSRHADEILWARNGPAILISDARLIRLGSFYGGKVIGFPMDFISSIDIDEEEDWSLAEIIVRQKSEEERDA